MLPTPDLSHISAEDYEHVYEPAEDTFLLLDALEADAEELKGLNPSICLEIGSGSGCVSTFVGKILGSSTLYLCTDINPHASRCSFSTGFRNRVYLDCINASFALPLAQRLNHTVDLIIFNPPYVPTITDEVASAQDIRDIRGSWAGGTDGMQVTDQFLSTVKDLMAPNAYFYLVALKQNDVLGISQRMRESYGLHSDVVLQRRAGREHLFVLRFMAAAHPNHDLKKDQQQLGING
ncbi:S-adenosyl-L-methionine-dependent methyltransferase [Infundibulicybe gibba]|nr:S-adenosyl-L-methionine-dependent methyltransferase [Infundibulicybe gibba]